jgi:proteic killer suppression protein
MIRSFADKDTEALFHGHFARRLPNDIQRVAQRKLRQIHAAEELADLRVPPGNHLESLERDRQGQHSIRINDQWRICFVWTEGGADKVEIVDYH